MLYLRDLCLDIMTPLWGAFPRARDYAIGSLQDNTDWTNINKQKVRIFLAQMR
jgi:hypothetical protein